MKNEINENNALCKTSVSSSYYSVNHPLIYIEFFADTGHWLISKGIIAINGVSVIQKSLLNEQSHEEQKEL
jgi:hypothetical protein